MAGTTIDPNKPLATDNIPASTPTPWLGWVQTPSISPTSSALVGTWAVAWVPAQPAALPATHDYSKDVSVNPGMSSVPATTPTATSTPAKPVVTPAATTPSVGDGSEFGIPMSDAQRAAANKPTTTDANGNTVDYNWNIVGTPPAGTAPTDQQVKNSKETAEATAAADQATADYNKTVANANELQSQTQDIQAKQNAIQNTQAQLQLTNQKAQLDNMKQAIAYLGNQWVAGVSSAHLDQVSDSIAKAQNTYDTMVSLQQQQIALQSSGTKFDTTQFTQQMQWLDDKFHTQVTQAFQDMYNQLSTASASGKIDNMDDFNKLQTQLVSDLNKGLANYATTNATERNMLSDWWNQNVQVQLQQQKDAHTVDENASAGTWVMYNSLGQVMKDASGNPIPYVKWPYPPTFDAANGVVISYSVWPDGKLKAKADPVTTGTSNLVTMDQRISIAKAVTAFQNWDTVNGISPKNAKKLLAGWNPDFTDTSDNSGGNTYQWPAYTPVDSGTLSTVTSALEAGDTSKVPNINQKQQCGAGVNDVLNSMGIQWNIFVDPISAKTAATNSKTATVGSVAVFDWSGSANATNAQKTNGHVWFVTKVDANWQPTEIADWNRNGDSKYNVHSITPSQAAKITGYFDPSKAANQNQPNQDYLYGDFTSTLPAQWKQNFESLPDVDKASVSQLVSGDALLSDIVKSRGIQGNAQIQKLINEAIKVDPSFSINTNKQRYDYQTKFNNPNNKEQQQITAAGTALQHLDLYKQALQANNNWDIQMFNKAMNALKIATGNPDVTSLDVIKNVVGDELASFYNIGTWAGKEKKAEDFEAYLSNTQGDKSVETQKALMTERLNNMNQSYKAVMGKDSPQITAIIPWNNITAPWNTTPGTRWDIFN